MTPYCRPTHRHCFFLSCPPMETTKNSWGRVQVYCQKQTISAHLGSAQISLLLVIFCWSLAQIKISQKSSIFLQCVSNHNLDLDFNLILYFNFNRAWLCTFFILTLTCIWILTLTVKLKLRSIFFITLTFSLILTFKFTLTLNLTLTLT